MPDAPEYLSQMDVAAVGPASYLVFVVDTGVDEPITGYQVDLRYGDVRQIQIEDQVHIKVMHKAVVAAPHDPNKYNTQASVRGRERAQTDAQEQEPDPAGDPSSDAAQTLTAAFNQSGFTVKRVEQEGSTVVFKLGHDDFDTLKQFTSQHELVRYDGARELNKIDQADVAQYAEEVRAHA